MKYLSICSGIEAATVAWHPLGWEPLAFSEIEPFPSAVLAHHYPDVPLHGDFTVLRNQSWIVDADVLVGGTPCQAFSVAGLRKSLDDDRGNLSLEFVKLADSIDAAREADGRDPCIIVWENVPGVLSVKDNAFGCFLAGLAGDVTPYVPPRGKWTNAGVVDGPQRQVAWRVLDAQYFGLAQRRRRVFVVASARAGFDPAEVLFEFEGVQRHSAPSREAGQTASASTASRAGERSYWDGDFPHPTLNQSAKVSGGVGSSNQELFSQRGAYLAPAHPVVMAHGQANAEIRTDGGTPALTCIHEAPIVAHPLRGEGFDASEDGTGRGTPLVPVLSNDPAHAICANEQRTYTNEGSVFQLRNVVGQPVAIPLQEIGKRTGASTDDPRAGIGIGTDGDPMFTLQAGAQHGVAAYTIRADAMREGSAKTPSADADGRVRLRDPGMGVYEELAPTLDTGAAHGVAAYAFQPRIARNGRGDMGDVVNALNAQSGETGKGDAAPCVATFPIDMYNAKRDPEKKDAVNRNAVGVGGEGDPSYTLNRVDVHAVASGMAVRRLTPVECERLQGFPDGYTMIPWKKKPAEDCPDGPRYKALGNSMAVPCMRWIGKRIAEQVR